MIYYTRQQIYVISAIRFPNVTRRKNFRFIIDSPATTLSIQACDATSAFPLNPSAPNTSAQVVAIVAMIMNAPAILARVTRSVNNKYKYYRCIEELYFT